MKINLIRTVFYCNIYAKVELLKQLPTVMYACLTSQEVCVNLSKSIQILCLYFQLELVKCLLICC